MYATRQNIIDSVINRSKQEGWSIEETNVQLVIAEGVRVVKNRIPRNIRIALNKAVKEGRLLHFKKDEGKPEVYCKPEAEFRAKEIRGQFARERTNALKAFAKVCNYAMKNSAE